MTRRTSLAPLASKARGHDPRYCFVTGVTPDFYSFCSCYAATPVVAGFVSQVSKRVSPSRALFLGTSVLSVTFAPE